MFCLLIEQASQESTKESPFFLLYGHDPQLQTEAALSADKDRSTLGLKEYGEYVSEGLTEAWNLAKRQVAKAQLHQKRYHDQLARPPKFTIGNWVFLFKPAEKIGENRKLARPYHGPYRIVDMSTNTAYVRRVDKPQEEPILVALDCLRGCPEEVPDEFWPPDKTRKSQSVRKRENGKRRQDIRNDTELPAVVDPPVSNVPVTPNIDSVGIPLSTARPNQWAGRLRSHRLRTVDPLSQGEV